MVSDVSTDDVQTLTEVPAKSCSFEPESSYGKLVVNHFCSGCILEKVLEGNELPLQYLITRVFPIDSEKCTSEKWMAEFVFSYALKSCLTVSIEILVNTKFSYHSVLSFITQVIEKQYPATSYSLIKSCVTFTHSSASLDYKFQPVSGWFIKRAGLIREVRITYIHQTCAILFNVIYNLRCYVL